MAIKKCTILTILEFKIEKIASNIFRTIPADTCAWIGASTLDKNQEYRWIELPQNYGESSANGELLNNTYNNFLGTLL